LLLDGIGVGHHGNGGVGVEGRIIAGGKAEEGFLCIFSAAVTDEPPGRFGSEDASD